jgi:hypothetical protein
MMLQKAAEWVKATERESINNNKDIPKWDITACGNQEQGYNVHINVGVCAPIFVSSQRQERRIFKTIDGLAKSLLDVGFYSFSVVITRIK